MRIMLNIGIVNGIVNIIRLFNLILKDDYTYIRESIYILEKYCYFSEVVQKFALDYFELT